MRICTSWLPSLRVRICRDSDLLPQLTPWPKCIWTAAIATPKRRDSRTLSPLFQSPAWTVSCKKYIRGYYVQVTWFFCFVLTGSHRKGTSPSSQLTFPYFLLNSAVTDWPVVCVCVCAPCHILTVKNDNASFRFHNVIWICQSRSICCHFAGADGRPRQHSSVFFLLMEVQEIAIWLHFGFPTDFLLCMHLFFFFSLPHPNWNSGKL